MTAKVYQKLINILQKLEKLGAKINFQVMKMTKEEGLDRLKLRESSKKITGKGKQDRQEV